MLFKKQTFTHQNLKLYEIINVIEIISGLYQIKGKRQFAENAFLSRTFQREFSNEICERVFLKK